MIAQLKLLKLGDWAVIFAYAGFVLVHVFTQFYLSANTTAEATQEHANNVVRVVEANGFAEWQFRLQNYGFIFKFVLFPAIYFVSYYLARRKYGYEAVESLALMIGMMATLNVFNDLGAVLGVMARKKGGI